jgi:hypothetical protein
MTAPAGSARMTARGIIQELHVLLIFADAADWI